MDVVGNVPISPVIVVGPVMVIPERPERQNARPFRGLPWYGVVAGERHRNHQDKSHRDSLCAVQHSHQ